MTTFLACFTCITTALHSALKVVTIETVLVTHSELVEDQTNMIHSLKTAPGNCLDCLWNLTKLAHASIVTEIITFLNEV